MSNFLLLWNGHGQNICYWNYLWIKYLTEIKKYVKYLCILLPQNYDW